MFKTLYERFEMMDRKMLTFELIIYLALTVSFGYNIYYDIQVIMERGISSVMVPFIVSLILCALFVPQLILIIMVKFNYYPFASHKKKKAEKKKPRKKQYKNNDIVEFKRPD